MEFIKRWILPVWFGWFALLVIVVMLLGFPDTFRDQRILLQVLEIPIGLGMIFKLVSLRRQYQEEEAQTGKTSTSRTAKASSKGKKKSRKAK